MTASEAWCTRDDLVALLGQTVGARAARGLIDAAAARCGVVGARLAYPQAEAILVDLSRSPGLVGITAQLAKSRLRMEAVRRRLGAVVSGS
ncbi:MAG TPA: hypothetical protein VFS43_33010 [Polyangiaceae bacterium]|nr:hypothetical protein [Polyangiaceae bacterium]